MSSISETRPATDPLATLQTHIQQSEDNGADLEKVVAGTQDGTKLNLVSFILPGAPKRPPKILLVEVTDPVDTTDQTDAVRAKIQAQGKTLLFLSPIFDAGTQKMVAVCRAGAPPGGALAGGVTANVPAPAPPPGGAGPSVTLSWDNVPLRKEWSQKLIGLVSQNRTDLEKGNPDGFVSGYSTLPSAAVKIKFWAELLVAMAKFESDWNPKNVFHEPPPLGVNSVGLLQLSLQDQDNYHLTPHISNEEELKNPLINLEWGVTIFAKLLARDGVVASGSSISNARGAARYWSVLWAGHKIDEIKTLTKKNVGLI